MSYKQISLGSRDAGSDGEVKKVQQLLNSTGKFNLEEDGIYGVQTQNAVKTYQKANNLAADGIVGEQTWSKLLQGDAPQTSPDSSTDAGDTLTPAPTPEDYAARMEALYQKWEAREPFSYDVQADPLYQQYRDVYTRQGQLAMMDTMGQAAALNGGYGSTYAQTAGQQTFQNYMQQLSAAVPELYGAAYDRYNAEGDRILQQYTLAKDMADNAYAKQTDNYNKLATLLPLGYSPTDDELTAAGMTRPQANTISGYYKSQNAQSTGSNSGYSYNPANYNGGLTDQEVRQLQGWLNYYGENLTVDGLYGSQTRGSVENLLGSDYDARAAYQMMKAISEVNTQQQAQAILQSKGITYYLPTQKEWLEHKKQDGQESETEKSRTYQQYLRDRLIYLLS